MRRSIARLACSLALDALLFLSTACATMGPTTMDREGAVSRSIITSADLEKTGMANAFDALRRVRPELLLRQANGARDEFQGHSVLYLDGVFQGKLDLLNTVPAEAVRDVRYYSAVAASHEFGAYHAGGVLAVRTCNHAFP